MRTGEVKSLVQSHKLLNPWETPILMGSRALSPDSLLSDRGGMCLPLELPIHLICGDPKKTDDNLCGKGGMGSAFKFTFESTPGGENSLLYLPTYIIFVSLLLFLKFCFFLVSFLFLKNFL